MVRKTGAGTVEQGPELTIGDQIRNVEEQIKWCRNDIESINYSLQRMNTRKEEDLANIKKYEVTLAELVKKARESK